MASVTIDPHLKIKLSKNMQELAEECFNEPKTELIVSEIETLKKFISEQKDGMILLTAQSGNLRHFLLRRFYVKMKSKFRISK